MNLRFFRRSTRDQKLDDLEEELRTHLRMAAQDRMDRGEAKDKAEAEARRAASIDPMEALRIE